jgi:hypothetical protein
MNVVAGTKEMGRTASSVSLVEPPAFHFVSDRNDLKQCEVHVSGGGLISSEMCGFLLSLWRQDHCFM